MDSLKWLMVLAEYVLLFLTGVRLISRQNKFCCSEKRALDVIWGVGVLGSVLAPACQAFQANIAFLDLATIKVIAENLFTTSTFFVIHECSEKENESSVFERFAFYVGAITVLVIALKAPYLADVNKELKISIFEPLIAAFCIDFLYKLMRWTICFAEKGRRVK